MQCHCVLHIWDVPCPSCKIDQARSLISDLLEQFVEVALFEGVELLLVHNSLILIDDLQLVDLDLAVLE